MPKPNLSLLDQHQQECAKLMRENCHRHRLHEVFRDFCELSALSFSNAVDKLQFETREARYLDIAKRYEREELNRFARMLACVTLSLEGGFKDSLGELFMTLELGDHWRGQYFTPYTVSYLMAKMTMGTSRSDIEAAGGFITLSEPTVGAGGMVIAAAQALHEEGINYQQCLHVTAQDIDATAVHMAYIQLALLHVPALVIHGDSLACSCWQHWATPAHVLGLWDIRLKRRADARIERVQVSASAEIETAVVGQAAPTTAAAIDETRTIIVADRIARADQMSLF